jgi:CheY-like chemotaxis protein
VVEDDDIDQMTVKRVFKELKVPNQLVIQPNGEDALAYLQGANPPKGEPQASQPSSRGVSPKADNEKPCLMFLDINMPRLNGWELLAIMRDDESLSDIPVIILTTSDSESDKKKAEQFRPIVIGYITKPVQYSESVKVIGGQLEKLNLLQLESATSH